MFFRKIKEMQGLINARGKALKEANYLLRKEVKENETLKEKIIDLENNIELLVNNLTPKKRELARPENQN